MKKIKRGRYRKGRERRQGKIPMNKMIIRKIKVRNKITYKESEIWATNRKDEKDKIMKSKRKTNRTKKRKTRRYL